MTTAPIVEFLSDGSIPADARKLRDAYTRLLLGKPAQPPAAPDLAARVVELEAENARWRNVAIDLHAALVAHTSRGCPQCPGDCSSANPPMIACPTQQALKAYRAFDAALKDQTDAQ